MFYTSEIQVTPLTSIRRERTLPVPGRVLVDIGDRVEATQVIARTDLPGDFHVLSAARLLGVRASRVKRHLQVKVGDRVHRGQVIAKRRGLIPRSVKSPADGVLAAISGQYVLIETRPTTFELLAYIQGTVTSVQEQQSVVIEAIGAVIQAAWGAGSENVGVLKCMVKEPGEPLETEAIDPSCHGMILVGGTGMDERVLERAEEFEARGIVVGGLQPELLPQVKHTPFPVVVTEGIGSVPMSTPAFRLLSTHDGRDASISAQIQTRWGIVRPEVIIQLPAETLPPAPTQPGTPLTIGTQVRATRAPHMGAVGEVVALPAHALRIETGARVRGAEVDLGEGTPVFIPLANLEILR
jgi:hypothetical protein